PRVLGGNGAAGGGLPRGPPRAGAAAARRASLPPRDGGPGAGRAAARARAGAHPRRGHPRPRRRGSRRAGAEAAVVTSSRAAFTAILAKDLRIELRTLRSVPAMALFAITTFVLFRFALDRTALAGDLAAGVLVSTLLFAAILAINRLFVAERDEGGFELMRLAPVDRAAMFAAKAAALFVYLLALELVAVPAFALFFLYS